MTAANLGAERKHDGATRGNSNYARVEHARQGEHAGVLTIRSVGRSAKERSQNRGKAVAEQRAMQTGIGNVVALASRTDSRDIADMLDHGREGQRHDGDDGRRGKTAIELRPKERKHGVVPHDGQANPGSGCDARKIDLAQRSRNGIAHHNAQQNRHNLNHATAPDVADDDNGNANDSHKPVGLAVSNSGTCRDQADGNDDGASHHRREEAHDALGAKGAEERRQHRIEQAGTSYARAGVGQKARSRRWARLRHNRQ